MKINNAQAAALIRLEAEAPADTIDQSWEDKIESLSTLCREGASKTHIAFLGTSILAKAMDRRVDLFAIKPSHAVGNANAYSARTLCHSVLVPLAAELGISLGVSGREPLNNQPYFRMTRLDDGTPVHAGGRAAFDYMLELVRELQALPDEQMARQALRAFIAVRRRHQPRYGVAAEEMSVAPDRLRTMIRALVQNDSEGGRRAQAVVAGLMDAFAGPERVESGRINDPSRNYPGDVCVRSAADPEIWEKAIEVRDKPVAISDIQLFGKKCVDMGVREAAVAMVSERQPIIDAAPLQSWANGFGIGLTLFHGWDSFIEQALFWSELPKPDAATTAAQFIRQRLIAVEASPQAVEFWDSKLSE